MITHTHTPSDRAVGRRLGLILRTSFFNRERERVYSRFLRALSLTYREQSYTRESSVLIYIYIYKRSFYKRERYYSLRESDECKEILIYSSRERVSERERGRVSERERERVFSWEGTTAKKFQRERRTERFSFFPTALLSLRDKLSSKINFLSQII